MSEQYPDLTVGVLLFDDAEELDFVGPWEVFTMAQKLAGHGTVVTLAETKEAITAAKGMRILADHTLKEAPPVDILVVPGGQGTRREASNQSLLDWISKTSQHCQWITSVCTGALLLYEAGIAKGKRVTTHWAFVESLRRRGDVTVLERERFVRDGQLVTAAGVSAGIDMALWLVGQIGDPEFARGVQNAMEYYPDPPYSEPAKTS